MDEVSSTDARNMPAPLVRQNRADDGNSPAPEKQVVMRDGMGTALALLTRLGLLFTLGPVEWLRLLKHRRIIEQSGLFDERYYVDNLPGDIPPGMDPLDHYLTQGWRCGLSPAPGFDPDFYTGIYEDLGDIDKPPLVHFISFGKSERRLTNPRAIEEQVRVVEESGFFDAEFYIDCHPMARLNRRGLTEHYVCHSLVDDLLPGAFFDPVYYRLRYSGISLPGICPLYHFLCVGRLKGRRGFAPGPTLRTGCDPPPTAAAYADADADAAAATMYTAPPTSGVSPDADAATIAESGEFDRDYYLRRYGEHFTDQPPLVHFLRSGVRRGFRPNTSFDPVGYALCLRDRLADEAVNPYAHYLRTRSKAARPGKIAVSAHIYGLSLLDEMCERFACTPPQVDIHVTTSARDHPVVSGKLARTFPDRRLAVSVCENIGWDIYPFISQFGPLARNYDLVCRVHSKQSSASPFPELARCWRDSVFNDLLGSRDRVRQIVDMFEDDERLGAVCPSSMTIRHLGSNYSNIVHLLERCGIPFSVNNVEELFFSAGSMLWFRPRALAPLFECGLDQSDFAEWRANDGTMAHAVERVMLFICRSQGFYWSELEADPDNSEPFDITLRYGRDMIPARAMYRVFYSRKEPLACPGRTDPGRTDPGRTDPGRTDPGRTDPGRTDPGRTDPGKTGPGDGAPRSRPARDPLVEGHLRLLKASGIFNAPHYARQAGIPADPDRAFRHFALHGISRGLVPWNARDVTRYLSLLSPRPDAGLEYALSGPPGRISLNGGLFTVYTPDSPCEALLSLSRELSDGISAAGGRALMLDCGSGIPEQVQHHLVLAPHEFFRDIPVKDRWNDQGLLDRTSFLCPANPCSAGFVTSLPFTWRAFSVLALSPDKVAFLRNIGIEAYLLPFHRSSESAEKEGTDPDTAGIALPDALGRFLAFAVSNTSLA